MNDRAKLESLRQASLVAKERNVPFEIWPGDENFVSLSMLPALSFKPYPSRGPLHTFRVQSTAELRAQVVATRKYAINAAGSDDGAGVEVGEWI